MKVKHLLVILQDKGVSPEADILLSIDEEGNAFNPLESVTLGDPSNVKEVILWP
jgi:hypothetical protein